MARRALLACAFALSLPACLELDSSPYDTSNGGLLGALITVLGAPTDPSVFLVFTDQTFFFETTGNGLYERVDFTGATGSVRRVQRFAGDILWGLDAKATNNIVRSDDFGKTWTSVNVAAEAFATLDICGTTIYSTFVNGGTQYGVHYSNDSGTTWNFSSLGVGAGFTTQDALCVSPTILYAAKNNSPHAQRSTDGGANWGAGGAIAGEIQPVRTANKTGTGDILIITQSTCPRSRLSTDGIASFGSQDSTTFSCFSFAGALGADSSAYYVSMRNTTNCPLYSNPDGTATNYTMLMNPACGAAANMNHVAMGNQTVLYGGNDAGSPALFRYSQSTGIGVGTTEVLPASAATVLTDIVFMP